MGVQFENFGFYTVNMEYLKKLHKADSQVFYLEEEDYERKPHLGLIVEGL